MRYLGGKTQISKELASIVNKYRDGKDFWDPFCGSLAMSVALGGRGLSSDIHPALIHLYKCIANGWDPPETLSKEEWKEAKNLPMENPLHGFAGFGCSFRGLYFSGYAGGYVGPASNDGCYAAKKVLTRDVNKLVSRGCEFEIIDFLSIEPSEKYFLYLDPPYRSVSGYAGTPAFDYERFVSKVIEWSRIGPVLVSEYSFPIGRCIWEKSRAVKMKAGSGDRATEKLFLIKGEDKNGDPI